MIIYGENAIIDGFIKHWSKSEGESLASSGAKVAAAFLLFYGLNGGVMGTLVMEVKSGISLTSATSSLLLL